MMIEFVALDPQLPRSVAGGYDYALCGSTSDNLWPMWNQRALTPGPVLAAMLLACGRTEALRGEPPDSGVHPAEFWLGPTSIEASDNAAGHIFGQQVALSADGTVLAVNASLKSAPGAVLVFGRALAQKARTTRRPARSQRSASLAASGWLTDGVKQVHRARP